jgi:hypothetical protein
LRYGHVGARPSLTGGGEYRPIERSNVIDLGRDELAEQIDWP